MSGFWREALSWVATGPLLATIIAALILIVTAIELVAFAVFQAILWVTT